MNEVSEREKRLQEHERLIRQESNAGRGKSYSYRNRDTTRKYGRRDAYSREEKNGALRRMNQDHSFGPFSEAVLPDPHPKEKANFKPSGLLAKESNNFKGIQLKYTEPGDAVDAPSETQYYLTTLSDDPQSYELNSKRFHLIGRDQKIADFVLEHGSCSKQHAVILFRSRPVSDKQGITSHQTIPYIIDLGSVNQTFLNGEKIPSERFIELRTEDLLRFGDCDIDYLFIKVDND